MQLQMFRGIVPAGFGLLVLICGVSGSAHANIVNDPGFESADPGAGPGTDFFTTGQSIDSGFWVVFQGTVGVDTDNFYVFAGNKSVFLDGNDSGPDALGQMIPTVPGTTYDISFWADADVPNTFSLMFGGTPVTGAPTSITENGFPSASYLGNSSQFVQYSGTATATAPITSLLFTATGMPSVGTGVTVEIDNVSVTPATAVPEPSTFVLFALAGALAIAWSRRSLARSR